MKSIEVTAVGEEAAVNEALEKLGLPREQVDVEIVKVSGLLRKKTTVRVTQKKCGDELAIDFIRGVIERMDIDCSAEISETDDAYVVQLSGNDTAVLIGYRGDVLDCLQYLSLLICNKNNPMGKRLVIDGENYRDKRTITLAKLAKKLAFKAAKSGQPVSLEPMNPFERRIIHSALHDDKFVTTESQGEEPNRYVVIKPSRAPRSGGYSDNRNRSDHREGRPARTSDRKPYEGNREGRERRPREEREPVSREPQTNNVSEPTDMYNTEYSRNFRKKGVQKMRSYGGPKSKYF